MVDVFQNFRETCLAYYGLDPCHYITSPGLAWDAMLKMTKIYLDLISDIEMQLFIEKGMRGGISYIAHRYAKANYKYMKNYNEKEGSSYIMYLDANNLYGWAMSQKLPSGNFHWIPCHEYINLDSYDENSAKGLILEVDLEYPPELYHLHNDYPCAPEKISVQKEMLSDYCREILDREKMPIGGVRKLIPTGTYNFKLAKWLDEKLKPLATNAHTVDDIFLFAEEIQNKLVNEGDVLVSYDVTALFTNIPVDEAIQILANKAFDNNWFNNTYNLQLRKTDLIELLSVSVKN